MKSGEKRAAKAVLRSDSPELKCFKVDADPPKLVPARGERDWMDASSDRFAYRCIPLSIANASGWELLCPFAIEATWHGGARPADVTVTAEVPKDRLDRFAVAHFGEATLTFHTGYIFQTSPGWALWARGIPNTSKRNIAPLEGLVETDWLPFSFTMNWRFTRTGRVRFEAGEPFCFVTPIPHGTLDQIQPEILELDADPDLRAGFESWSASRNDFNRKLAELEPATVKQGWQRNYVQGRSPSGESALGFHISKRKLKTPIVR